MSFESVARKWIDALDDYSREELLRKPSPAEWSIGQVYGHLLETTTSIANGAIPIALDDCAKNIDRKVLWLAKPILWLGFPPFRFRAAKVITQQPAVPDDMEQLRRDFEALVTKLHELARRAKAAKCSGKTKHPRMGYLNAKEWIRFVEIHWAHHLRQKRRLDVFLGRR
jgi:hypothetical protein